MNLSIVREGGRHTLDDTAIVRRILQGEKAMFEILMRRHNQKLYRVIRGYLREEEDVADAMQDTYLKVFARLDQFRGEAAFSTWLIRIGINEALLRLKRNKVRSLHSSESDISSDQIIQLTDGAQMNPEKLVIRQEAKKLLEQAVDELPQKYKTIYILKEIEGMDNGEIAQCLGLTESNVKVRIHRSRALIKESLLELAKDAQVFEFGNHRCDALVQFVMQRI